MSLVLSGNAQVQFVSLLPSKQSEEVKPIILLMKAGAVFSTETQSCVYILEGKLINGKTWNRKCYSKSNNKKVN